MKQFKLLGETGNEVLAMVKAYDKNDQSLFMPGPRQINDDKSYSLYQ